MNKAIHLEEAYDRLDRDVSLAYWYFPQMEGPKCLLLSGPENVRPGSTDAELAVVPVGIGLTESHRFVYNRTGVKLTAYEISLEAGDRSLSSIRYNLNNLKNKENVIITNASTIIHKLGLLRSYNVAMYVGIDTAADMLVKYGYVGTGGLRGNFIICDALSEKSFVSKDFFAKKPSNVHFSHLNLIK